MKTCIDCKKPIADDARFCPYCGTDQVSSSFSSDPEDSPEGADASAADPAGGAEDEPAPDDSADDPPSAGERKNRRRKAALSGAAAFAALILIAVGTHSALSGFLKNNNQVYIR